MFIHYSLYLQSHEIYSECPYFWICFQPVEYLQVAEKAANFIKEKLYDASSKRLHHSYRNGPAKAPGFLDDYAFLINGLLDLYEYGGKIEWLLWAVQLQVIQARETYLLDFLMLCFMSIA
jgi:uncharacterized protein YyaL (SSP411 family)